MRFITTIQSAPFFATLVLITFISFVCQSQNPGGISNNLSVWLKADANAYSDAGTTLATDTDAVEEWHDQTSTGDDAIQTTSGNRATYSESSINFNPALDFDRSSNNYYVLSVESLNLNSDHTIYAVVDREVNDNSQISILGTTSGAGYYWGFGTRTSTSLGISYQIGIPGSVYPLQGGGGLNITSTDPMMISASRSNDDWDARLNGLETASTNFAVSSAPTAAAVEYRIGFMNSANYFDGRIAEIIQYSADLSADEERKVETYLALKYGTTLDHTAGGEAGDYVNSASTTIWDASDNSFFHNEVIGMIRDDLSGLHQKQSRNVENTAGLTIYNGSGYAGTYPTSNQSNSNTLTDYQSLVIGHNDSTVSFLTTNRMGRIYKVVDNGSVGTVTLYFNNSTFTNLSTGNTYYIITSTDGVFDADDSSVALTEDGTSGNYYIEIDFDNNSSSYFTLLNNSIASTPGNVSTDLEVWLKGEAGTNCSTEGCGISSWTDQSSNGHAYSQGMVSNQPTIDTDGSNFNPSLSFNGTSDHMDGPSLDPTKNLSIVAVVKQVAISNNHIFAEVTDADDKQFSLSIASNKAEYHGEFNSNNSNVSGASDIGTSIRMIGTHVDNSLNTTIRLDGVTDGTGTLAAEPTNTAVASTIGTWDYEATFFDGDIAEIILYDAELTGTDLQKVESYLAIKHGITLDNTAEGTTGDYINSLGSTIWDASVNKNYHNGIIAIIGDGGSSLNQKQSRSVEDATGLTIYKGSGYGGTYPASNQSNSSTMIDNQSLVIGHDGDPTTFNTLNTMQRSFIAVDNGGVSAVTLYFDNTTFTNLSTGNTYYLVISTDGVFDSGDTSVTLTEDGTSGNYYVEIDFDNNTSNYFTLANNVLPFGPGGVSSNLLVWLKADANAYSDAGTTLATDTEEVQEWHDQSSTGDDATQSTSGNRATYSESSINFNPALDFVRSNSNYYVLSVESLNLNNDHSIYTMVDRDLNANSQISILGTTSGAGYYWGFGTRTTNSPGISYQMGIPGTVYPLQGGGGLNITSTGPMMICGSRSSDDWDARLNGLETANTNFALSTAPTGATVEYRVGYMDSGNYFDGRIAEIIEYSVDLSADDQRKVESYLALKYGTTLDHTAGGEAGDYVNSAGTTIWDASTNETYQNDITGLIGDGGSGLNQKQSRNVENPTGLSVYHGIEYAGTFPASNQSNLNTMTDNQSLVMGHDGATTSFLTTNRMDRIYQVVDEGGVNTVTLYFDNATFTGLSTGNTYYFITSSDAIFDIPDSTIPMIEHGTTGNYYVEFDFSDNTSTFFTLINNTIATSPGGIDTNLTVWLRTDAGTDCSTDGCNISSWTDRSVNNNLFVQSNGSDQPALASNSTNYNPSLTFDGTDDHMDGPSFDATKNLSIMAVIKQTTALSNHIFAEATDVNDTQFSLSLASDKLEYYGELTGNDAKVSGASDVGSSPRLIGAHVDNVLNTTIRLDGASDGTGTLAAEPTNTAVASSIGTWNFEGNFFDGDIAEIIMYDAELTGIDLQKVESYLAIKYSITLDNTAGGTAGDYINPAGTLIWDASDNSSYHTDLIGIVRDDFSGLLQKQSVSMDDSLRLYVGGLATSNQLNTSTITNDLSSIIVGNNQAQLRYIETTEFPAGITTRFEREWKMTNTNFTDDYSIEVKWDSIGNFDIDDIRLLVDDDGNFNDASYFGSSDVNISLGSTPNSILVSGIGTNEIAINTTKYITIGSVSSSTQLPVDLISFSAKPTNERTVSIVWNTASEINNDYFSIERSLDALEWKRIATINSRGDSNYASNYTTVDKNPYENVSYYRLKQTDKDGGHKYFDPVMVDLKSSSEIDDVVLFPNPVTGDEIFLDFDARGSEPVYIEFYDLIGRNIRNTQITNTIDSESIPVGSLFNGVYILKIRIDEQEFLRKLIIER
ncbi:MAG: T9SS type A sorting domain-containing protein [Reichenbachiella sp.]|uniref:T9SS type A sorting domain-containing protein n=1 Tax=Reichenbachiella sp. TaxID=2184521 RepID=UPI0032645DA2